MVLQKLASRSRPAASRCSSSSAWVHPAAPGPDRVRFSVWKATAEAAKGSATAWVSYGFIVRGSSRPASDMGRTFECRQKSPGTTGSPTKQASDGGPRRTAPGRLRPASPVPPTLELRPRALDLPGLRRQPDPGDDLFGPDRPGRVGDHLHDVLIHLGQDVRGHARLPVRHRQHSDHPPLGSGIRRRLPRIIRPLSDPRRRGRIRCHLRQHLGHRLPCDSRPRASANRSDSLASSASSSSTRPRAAVSRASHSSNTEPIGHSPPPPR